MLYMYYFLKKRRIFFVIIILFIVSCKYYKARKNINSLVGHELVLPTDVMFIYKNKIYKNDTFNILKSNNKVVTYITGDCHACFVNINKWQSMIDSFKLCKIPVLFYIHVGDIEYFKKILYPEIKVDYPYIIDTSNSFYLKNRLYNYNNFHYYTFLVGKNNKIILVGNPAISQKVRDLYIKTIKNYSPSRNR